MIKDTLCELGWYVRLALASMMAASTSWEHCAVANYRLDDLREERPDLV